MGVGTRPKRNHPVNIQVSSANGIFLGRLVFSFRHLCVELSSPLSLATDAEKTRVRLIIVMLQNVFIVDIRLLQLLCTYR